METVVRVTAQANYQLKIEFRSGEVRLFDVKPYLAKGIFQQLQNLAVFNSVRPFLGSIQWSNEADLCPDTLYERSVLAPNAKPKSLQVAESRARYGRKRRERKS